MDFLTIAFIAWLITKWTAGDAPYALRGKMPPRHLERMERLRRGEQAPARYGVGDYLRDLGSMALRADIERRQRKARRKKVNEPAAAAAVPSTTSPEPPSTTGGSAERRPNPATVPDPAAKPDQPRAGTAAGDPSDGGEHSDGVVHTDEHTYCLEPGCPTCRPPQHGWSCPTCGTRREGFASEDEARADAASHPCTPRQRQDPTEANGQPAAGGLNTPGAGVAATPRRTAEQVDRAIWRRCVYPVPDNPNGMCGAEIGEMPPWLELTDKEHCAFHAGITQYPYTWSCGTCDAGQGRRFRTQAEADADAGQHTCTTDQPAQRSESGGQVIPFPVLPNPDGQPNQQGDQMSTETNTTTAGVSEITGLASAVHYTKGVAAAHQSHGSGEGFVASLREFQVGDADVTLVEAAQEASRNAAEKWQAAADALTNHNAGVREAYQSSPEAGNKQFATSE